MTIRLWSTTAASNNSSPPNGAPEGMAPSGVNNTLRQIMAEVRDSFEDLPWFDYGHTPTRQSNTAFTVPTDLTAIYTVGRRLQLVGATTGYCTISSSSYSAPDTTVNVTMDSGNVPTSLTNILVGSDLNGSSPAFFPATTAEKAVSVTPTTSYPAGDPRRSSWYTSQGWIDLGDVPTRTAADTFTVPGDKTARYTKYTRLQLSGASTHYYGKVSSSSYSGGTGLTTVVTTAPPYGGSIPVDVARVSIALAAVTNEENSFVLDQNALVSQWFINQSTGTAAVSGLTIGDTAGTALAIRVTGTNYSGTFLSSGGVSGKSVNIHTGSQTPIVIGVNDYGRMVFTLDNEPVRVQGSVGQLFRFLSPGSTGDCYMSFYRSNNTTRKGYLGFDSSANNNFSINNDETGTIVITTAAGNISLNPSTNTLTFQNLKISQGNGSPEGVVTAEVGSLYLRTDGGATTTLYVKTSGTGNTGWTGK